MASETVVTFAEPLALLAAAVIAVPLFKRFGLGSVLGYLCAGLAIGPYGLGVVDDADRVLHVAELGVILLLFLIGLELKPSRLWSMRRDIFGLGSLQVVLSMAALAGIFALVGYDMRVATIAGAGLALSSTAFAMQILQERGHAALPFGRRAFSILLLQDMAIVPLLTLVSLLSTRSSGGSGGLLGALGEVAAIAGAVGVVVFTGRFLLNPAFRMLAGANAREIMTAAGLLVVLGAATLMQVVGISMAMGAFLAGVLLSESNFRLTLEADLDPFRGLLLGLFFIGVGMTLNLALLLDAWLLVLGLALATLVVKGVILYVLSRLFGSSNADALLISATLPQGGEFAFVLYSAAVAGGIFNANLASLLAAVVVLTMILTPVITMAFDRVVTALRERGYAEEFVETFEDARARVVVIGFGRFGRMAAQMLEAEGIEITALDNSAARIREAAKIGVKVYYGDATRADVLRAAGCGEARLIALCMESPKVMHKAVEMIQAEFPQARVYCRARDRLHAVELIRAGVDFQIRETVESGLVFGRQALLDLGTPPERVREIEADVRKRDLERLDLEVKGDMTGSLELLAARPNKTTGT
ncbi:monovalent cation:proton antiporter-2 (CPA2) family protein [Methylobrevis pamukkalensis]|uniref:Glutathione-regulated potassium-efflux system protein KefC n=1 Tax=Methylobrevis pamukkalensis TaxID=1439726 RepID=A0A1E3H665_9HYPH|nr:monovalent cation:proton antiporter-2 (CPA2) family protein [Methylobrevis pamukkalensis]ODN71625.1 Glutathione-regulated potassium-efflux system protein KefC [Methylobrevis pamukkalensis]